MSAARELVPGLADPLPEPADPLRDAAWAGQPAVRRAHRRALREVCRRARDLPPPPPGRPAGLVTAGGGKYWPGVVTGLRLARELGITLPAQVWYRGSVEAVRADQVRGLDVELVDAERVAAARGDARLLGGWEVKTYALTHTDFDAAVYLDADAYLVADPAPLLGLAAQAGFVYWGDLYDNVKWPLLGGTTRATPSVQGGQLALDRRRAWPLLAAAHWVNQHSDYYYHHLYGDQDAWRLAMTELGDPGLSLGPAAWGDTAFTCSLVGRPLVVHRCQGKLFRPADVGPEWAGRFATPRWELPREERVFHHFARVLADDDAHSAFAGVYHNRLWGGASPSGPGSTPAEFGPYVGHVRRLLGRHGGRSVLDVGAGDGVLAARLPVADYTGVDVVPELVDRNRAAWPEKEWLLLDAWTEYDRLPAADVLLCKDVLQHWPNHRVREFVTRVAADARWRWALFTQDRNQHHDGEDCHPGGYRGLRGDWAPLAGLGLARVADYGQKTLYRLECGGAA